MNELAAYYTVDIFSSLLVKEITVSNPQVVLDLGIGSGSLTNAAIQKWGGAIFFGVDIDCDQIKKTKTKYPLVSIIEASGLDKNIEKKLKIRVGSVDVAICNPPYLRIKLRSQYYMDLFNKVGLNTCSQLKFYTSDLLFLAQNLLFLKEGGELGIILPDGLLTSHEFELFRRDIVENHTLLTVIQLPDNIFKGTEARTHILVIRKGKQNPSDICRLFLADRNGSCQSPHIEVKTNKLIKRMDYLYHSFNHKETNTKNITLSELGADIRRGQLSHQQLRECKNEYIHTTTLKHLIKLTLNSNIKGEESNFVHTDKNDILLARVGKGCIGKVSIVESGEQLISDCVYRIRVKQEYVSLVWKALISDKGQKWLKSTSHGVCAKVVSKTDLLNFPIHIEK